MTDLHALLREARELILEQASWSRVVPRANWEVAADKWEKAASAALAEPQEPDGYLYEFPSPFGGVHLSLSASEWNGSRALRAIPYYLAPQPVMQWRPISEAPTDGRLVLKYTPADRRDSPDDEYRIGQVDPQFSWATHWMPLPLPPLPPRVDETVEARLRPRTSSTSLARARLPAVRARGRSRPSEPAGAATPWPSRRPFASGSSPRRRPARPRSRRARRRSTTRRLRCGSSSSTGLPR